MELRSPVEGLGQTEGMGELLSPCNGLLAPLPCLFRVAQKPQGPGQMGQACHAVVRGGILDNVRGWPRCAGEGEAVLQMGTRQSQLAEMVQDGPQSVMGAQQEDRIVLLLGEAETLFGQLPHAPEFSSIEIQHAHAPQHPEELRCRVEPPAQLARPHVDVFHVGGRMSPGGDQRWPQNRQESEFGSLAVGGLRQRRKDGQRGRQVLDGFLVGAPLQRILRRVLSVPHRPEMVPAPLEMSGQLGGTLPGRRTIALLELATDPPMQLDAASFRYPLVDHLLMQNVAEPVAIGHRPVRPCLHPAP